MQDICDFILYPHDVFCPKSHATGIISITEQTVTIHHFSGSWQNKEGKISASIKRSMNGKVLYYDGFLRQLHFRLHILTV